MPLTEAPHPADDLLDALPLPAAPERIAHLPTPSPESDDDEDDDDEKDRGSSGGNIDPDDDDGPGDDDDEDEDTLYTSRMARRRANHSQSRG